MSPVSPAIQRLAAELLALEAIAAPQPEPPEAPAHRIFEALRATLITLVGLPGYKVLLARTLVVARERDPSLKSVRFADNGSLEGFGAASSDPLPTTARPAGNPPHGRPAPPVPQPPPAATHPPTTPHPQSVLLVTHFLGLLSVFVGEPMTFQLVRTAWSHAPANALSPVSERQP